MGRLSLLYIRVHSRTMWLFSRMPLIIAYSASVRCASQPKRIHLHTSIQLCTAAALNTYIYGRSFRYFGLLKMFFRHLLIIISLYVRLYMTVFHFNCKVAVHENQQITTSQSTTCTDFLMRNFNFHTCNNVIFHLLTTSTNMLSWRILYSKAEYWKVCIMLKLPRNKS